MAGEGFRLGVDIGGTFTDFVLRGPGAVRTAKVLTTADPSEGVLQGIEGLLREHAIAPGEIEVVLHATTLVTNALIERKGARTALVATDGFADVLEIGSERGYDVYDIGLELPRPLVPRHLRLEVPERLAPDGRVLEPLDEAAARRVAQRVADLGVEAVAICFLHAYRNPAHEQRMAEIVRAANPDVAVSLSSAVLPEIREYPRLSTTVANAYVQRQAAAYLDRLVACLRALGLRATVRVMLSSGGVTTCEAAARFPVRIVESGPAAGVLAAAALGERTDRASLLSFDMGGTTAKICLIDDGEIARSTDFEVAREYWYKRGSGLPISVPVINLIEIGAGGGSLASVGQLGLLSVGPASAGASPGPACYGRGGTAPTVTDADLLLGYLNPAYFLGGALPLDLAAARLAVQTRVADRLGIDLVRAAWGIHEVVNENMANAARVHIAERGRDARRYALVAFGGAGPVHACGLARKLGLREVVVPGLAGVASAGGLLSAPQAFDLVRSYVTRLDRADSEALAALYRDMEEEGRALLRGAGVGEDEITVQRSCNARYVGQGFEIGVSVPTDRLGAAQLGEIQTAFERTYCALYGHLNEGVAVEVLNWRTRVAGSRPAATAERLEPVVGRGDGLKGVRPAYFAEAGGLVSCPVYDRALLSPGSPISGPALVEERETTVVVGPGASAVLDPFGNMILTLSERRERPDRIDAPG